MIYHLIFAILLIGAVFCAYQMSRADLRRRIIPDAYLFPFMLIGLIVTAFFPWFFDVGSGIIAATFGYALGALVGFVFERRYKKKLDYAPIGLGDVKLLAAGGIWLGMTGLSIAIIAACVAAGIWGLRRREKFVPFAPFFFAGGIIALTALFFLI